MNEQAQQTLLAVNGEKVDDELLQLDLAYRLGFAAGYSDSGLLRFPTVKEQLSFDVGVFDGWAEFNRRERLHVCMRGERRPRGSSSLTLLALVERVIRDGRRRLKAPMRREATT